MQSRVSETNFCPFNEGSPYKKEGPSPKKEERGHLPELISTTSMITKHYSIRPSTFKQENIRKLIMMCESYLKQKILVLRHSLRS